MWVRIPLAPFLEFGGVMVFITGDTHGLLDVLKLSNPYFPARSSLTKKDYLIVAGDFGGLWDGSWRDEKTLDFFSSEPYTTLFVDGNHENFDLLKKYPVEEWNGGKIQRIREDIFHLMRGQVFNIEGHTYFTFGGGLSIDKLMRKEHISWWREEYASEDEKKEALENLEKHGNKVDFVITHTCPEIVKREGVSRCIPLKNAKCETEAFLDEIIKKLTYKSWFFGHYHADLYFEEYRMLCLYQEVVDPTAIVENEFV